MPAVPVNFQSNVIPPGLDTGMFSATAPNLTDGQIVPLMLDNQGRLMVATEPRKCTYRAGQTGLTFFSTSAAVLCEIKGSATMTVRIKKITLWGQAATKFYTELQLLRCTGVSAGTPTVSNNGKHDINDPAATAVVNYYTTAAAQGAGAAIIGAQPLTMTPPSATLEMLITQWNFAANDDKPLILRGAGDVLEIYNSITGFGAGTWGFEIEWEEDNS